MPRSVLILLSLFAMLPPATAAAADPWRFEAVDGKVVEPFADEKTRAFVAVFIATDCPIANYFQPTLRRLQERFEEEGVRFLMIHADPSVDVEAAKEHAAEYGIEAPVVRDPEFVHARRLKAAVTPQAFLVGRDGQTRYSGRINDLYAAFGKKRRAPRSHDLRDAIVAFLGGREIPQPETKAIGCYIPYPQAAQETGSSR